MSSADYSVFGLRVRSEIDLPELYPAEGDSEPDVRVRMGRVPRPDNSRPGIEAHDGALVLTIPEVAHFGISGGKHIVIEPAPGVPERNVRLYLLGSAFGALLHQRGLLPLHANAIEIDGKAVAFMGESGAGKSTLAAWFHDRGFRVITDDVSVVGFDERGRATVAPGVPRLRLWEDALVATGRDMREFQPSYAGETEYEKYDVPLQTGGGASAPLAAIYLLVRGHELKFKPLTGVAAAKALFAHTYRGGFVECAGSEHIRREQFMIEEMLHTPL